MVLGFVASFISVGQLPAQSDAPGADRTTRQELQTENTEGAAKVPPPGDAVGLLLKPISVVDWDEKPFEEVLEWLRDEGDNRVNILPKWGALSIEGVDAEKAITLRMTNTTVARIMSEVLDQLSEEGRLRYYAMENDIRITTQADSERKLFVRTYNVADILFQVPNFGEEAPQIDLSGQGGGGGGGQGGQSGQGSIFQNAGGQGQQQQGEQNEQELETQANRLRDVIILTVMPETWEDTPSQTGGGLPGGVGGLGKGRIRVYNRHLVVYNSIEVHEQIGGWFSAKP
jgi:hypothetical protein